MSEKQSNFLPVTTVQRRGPGATKAIGSVTIGNVLVLHGVRVGDGEKGSSKRCPSDRTATATVMWRIGSNAVLKEYERLKNRETQERRRVDR